MEKFWMCYVEGKSAPVYKHASLEDAQVESERLAGLSDNVGRKVFLLKCEAFCQVVYPPVNWVIL